MSSLRSKINRFVSMSLVAATVVFSWPGYEALAQTEGNAAAAPADTQDEATASDEPIPTRSLWTMLKAGGVLMIPLVACSFVLLVFVFERFISLRRGSVVPKPFVKRFLEQLEENEIDQNTAIELCEANGSPVARVFGGAVRKWGRPSVEVEQGVIDAGERVTNELRRHLRVLNGITTVSPLLGLLGTVWGMMEAFNVVASAEAMGRPELLAAGIGLAMITTATGLAIAIPALIFYLYFVGRVDRLIIEIDMLGQQVVDLISAEATTSRRRDKAKARGATKAA